MRNIAIHGVPRSGTSWLGAIFDSNEHAAYRHQPLFSYAFKSFLDENSSKNKIEEFFGLLAQTEDDFILQRDGKVRGTIPEFNKTSITHIVYKEARYHNIISNMLNKNPNVQIIGIVRNPKSVISSWFNAPKEFNKQEWKLSKQWRVAELKNQSKAEEFYGYNKWKEVTELFLQLKEQFPDRFYLVEYANLLLDTENVVKEIFTFCGLEYGEQTKAFLEDSNAKDLSSDAYSVYRKKQKDTKWQDDLPEEIIKAIDQDLVGTKLEVYL